LLLGVHAHQPVGNFSEVLQDAHQRCYRPFLHTLARYPGFRFAAHFSGWLLAELERDHPEDMALLRAMVDRGQVEMVGGGIAEPVLAAIPHRDRLSQLRAMNAHLAARYGAPPTGAWLTERVW
jgi:alpha-amylase/alpha-mannosidase (GH57 family)